MLDCSFFLIRLYILNAKSFKVETERRGEDKRPVWLIQHWSSTWGGFSLSTPGLFPQTPWLSSFHTQHYIITIGCHDCTMKDNSMIKTHCGSCWERREGCWRQGGIKETVRECLEADWRTEEEERNVREWYIERKLKGKRKKRTFLHKALKQDSSFIKKVRQKEIIKYLPTRYFKLCRQMNSRI